jgi:hypothetical protein
VDVGGDYGLVVNARGILLYERGYVGSVVFEGVGFTYFCGDVSVAAGQVVQDNVAVGGSSRAADVLVHRSSDLAPLFFGVSEKVFPPGRYNVTVVLKVSSVVSGDAVTLEFKENPGDAGILTGRIEGADFTGPDVWQVFSFDFAVGKPTFVSVDVSVGNSTDVYFYSLGVLQVSGAVTYEG